MSKRCRLSHATFVVVALLTWMAAARSGMADPDRPPPVVTVTDAAGRPVAGAEVWQLTARDTLDVTDGTLSINRRDPNAPLTDADGRAALPGHPTELTLVVAVHREHGYGDALADTDAPADRVVLRPWGRIDGRLTLDGQPAAGVRLSVAQLPGVMPMFWARDEVVTDDHGRFSLARVKPGTYQVSQGVEQYNRHVPGTGVAAIHRPVGTVDVRPGEASVREFDGTVLEVRGTVVTPDGAPQGAVTVSFEPVGEQPEEPIIPDDLQLPDPAARAAAIRAWKRTPAGREFADAMSTHFAVRRDFHADVSPDGKFAARGLLPGEYDMTARASTPDFNIVGVSDPIRVTVDATARSVDVGEVRLWAVTSAAIDVGQTMPPLPLEHLDGSGPIDLAGYRGRHVLLCGWGISCGPCIAAVPKLVTLHDRFSADPRVAMVSICFDKPPAARARAFVERRRLGWTQARADGAAYDAAAGFRGVPDYVLLDPAGVVLARGHDLDAVIARLDAAVPR